MSKAPLNEPGYATRPLIVYKPRKIFMQAVFESRSGIICSSWTEKHRLCLYNLRFRLRPYAFSKRAGIWQEKRYDSKQSKSPVQWLAIACIKHGRKSQLALQQYCRWLWNLQQPPTFAGFTGKKFYKRSDLKADLWFEEVSPESMVIATPIWKKANQILFQP